MQTIFPILRYNDARAAMQWLCQAFGCVQLFSVPESGSYVRHARLKLGSNLIMVGSVRPGDGIASPTTLGSATQMLAVHVEDPDAHFERARAAGAKVLAPPNDTDFGSREYHVLDLEGHPWTFGTFLPTVDEDTTDDDADARLEGSRNQERSN
jgi:uncharacterized glyoxalase superfamily protein PhnB